MRAVLAIGGIIVGTVLASTPVMLANTVTGTQILNPRPGAIGKLTAVQATSNVTHSGATFAAFAGSDALSYKIRTTISTGTGSITVKATANFPAGGPSVTNGDLTYTCGGATLGTACTGAQTVSTTTGTNVIASFPAGSCTGSGCGGSDPNSVTINLSLVDNPAFQTGSYSATLTFTISGV
jgi:hypothetical protein